MVYNQATYSNAAVNAVCSLADSSTAVMLTISSGCVASLTSAHQSGSAALAVTASFAGLSATATFRVWFPEVLVLALSGTSLGLVARGGDGCTRFQQATVTATATFTAGAANSLLADVSTLVAVVSSNPAVAAIAAQGHALIVVKGVSPGTSKISFSLPVAANPGIVVPTPVTVTVSNNVAPVATLRLVIYSAAQWASSVGSVNVYATATPALQLAQTLTAEGQKASVAVYAYFKDGTVQDVSQEVHLRSQSRANVKVFSNTSIVIPVRHR